MTLIDRDLSHNWHPCTQMKDYLLYDPITIKKTKGSYLYLENGRKIIDAISSWWCKSLGHSHPRLKNAILKQIEKFEHVIQARTTNETIVQLSEKLCSLTDSLNKVYYTSSGSNAVEVAIKMSLHFRKNMGQEKKIQFISLKNSYHGETIGAMSVSDLSIYKSTYHTLLFQSHLLDEIPYVSHTEEALWYDSNDIWEHTAQKLNSLKDSTTAIIIEPIVQGTGGMKIYSQDFLKKLRAWSKDNDVHLIADEIMTGIGRTGKMFACEHANIEPDFMCIGKGLTSGWLPFSAVLTTNIIYEAFYDDFEKGKAFMHSETYCGNPLGAAIALETLNIIDEDNILSHVNQISPTMLQYFQHIAFSTGKIKNIRNIGAIIAAELIPHPSIQRIGLHVASKAIQHGALLRPMNNTLYWLPPLNINSNELHKLFHITQKSLEKAYWGS